MVVKLKNPSAMGVRIRARNNETIVGDVPVVKSLAWHVSSKFVYKEENVVLHRYYGCSLVLWEH